MDFQSLAKDAFEKAERVRALETMNTPLDYLDRMKAYIALMEARQAATEAQQRIDALINGVK